MSCIKSIQRGTGTGNQTITISEVDVNKAVVLIFGGLSKSSPNIGQRDTIGAFPIATLSNSTTITVSNANLNYHYYMAGTYADDTSGVPYCWQVIEFA